MIFKIHHVNEGNQTIYARIDDDGLCRVTCSEDNPEFKAWLSEGNTPLAADATEPADEV